MTIIRQLRESKSMSQATLASQVGVSRESISRYEDGTRTPSLKVLKKLAKALNVTIDELVNGKPA